jgi:hypothetical protein
MNRPVGISLLSNGFNVMVSEINARKSNPAEAIVSYAGSALLDLLMMFTFMLLLNIWRRYYFLCFLDFSIN